MPGILSKEAKPSAPNRPERSGKHWIFVLSYDLKPAAKLWAELREAAGKDYSVVEYDGDKESNQLGCVRSSDVLYLFLHGEATFEKVLNVGGKGWKTPQEVAYLLFKKGLDPNHREIKLFACHSVEAGTAQALQLGLKILDKIYSDARPYQHVVVYGYEGKVAVVSKNEVQGVDLGALKLLAKPVLQKYISSRLHKVATCEGEEFRTKHQRIQYGEFT